MAKKEQHFVPKVYLKSWETTVFSSNEPTTPFKGIYRFDNGSTEGEGATRDTVLWEPHLYTIRFGQRYMANKCPDIYRFFADEIYDAMKNNSPKPVYGKFGSCIIKTKSNVRKNLNSINDWDFLYYDGSTARKKKLLKKFDGIRCYLLEDSFSSVFESKWEETKKSFLNEMRKTPPVSPYSGLRKISEQTVEKMLEFFYMMLCRSPHFDPFGTYTGMRKMLKDTFLSQEDEIESDEREEISKSIDEMMKAVWYTELYRMLYEKRGGFYHSALASAFNNCQIVLIEAAPNAGSFITSDNPAFRHVSFVERVNRNGFYFPIDPIHMLIIAKGEGTINEVNYKIADSGLIRVFNRITASHKARTVISNIKRIASLL